MKSNGPELQGRFLSAPETPEAHQAAAEFVEWLIQLTLEEERLEAEGRANDESDHAH